MYILKKFKIEKNYNYNYNPANLFIYFFYRT
jgi:hypothetical protein